MTAFLSFGVGVLVMAAWITLAFGVALIFGAFATRNQDKPSDLNLEASFDYPSPEDSPLEATRNEMIKRAERGMEAAQRARARRVV